MKLKPLIKNKKGVLGLDIVKSVMYTLLVLAVVAIAVFLALVSLQDAGIFTAGSQADNDTDLIINNITTGTVRFFKQVPTIFTVLGVVAIIAAIAVIIAYVSRMGGGREAGL